MLLWGEISRRYCSHICFSCCRCRCCCWQRSRFLFGGVYVDIIAGVARFIVLICELLCSSLFTLPHKLLVCFCLKLFLMVELQQVWQIALSIHDLFDDLSLSLCQHNWQTRVKCKLSSLYLFIYFLLLLDCNVPLISFDIHLSGRFPFCWPFIPSLLSSSSASYACQAAKDYPLKRSDNCHCHCLGL